VVLELAKHPETWLTIHAISRSQKEAYPDSVKQDNVNLIGAPSDIAVQLQGIEAEYLFFCAYVQKDDEAEQVNTNGESYGSTS
jgi:hypothetical protein